MVFHVSLVAYIANLAGITPFVKPDDLKFFFEEIHRLTA